MLMALLPLSALSADINLVFRQGEPIQDREAAWEGHIEFASWIDDEIIVYLSRGHVTCISTRDSDVKWTVKDVGKISDWSVSRKTKRLAILGDNNTTSVIDCNDGKTIFTADRSRMARILGLDFALPSRIAMAPNDGRLVLCTFSTFHGRNGYVLDPSYTTVISSFDVDASPNELSLSPNGRRAAVIADDAVLCVRDLVEDRDVFFRGTRIKEKPDSLTATIDAPFFSHLRDGGGDHLIYTLDNSWATGKVFVHNLKTNKINSVDGRNGHIELDVSFSTGRIALTGTSTDLTVLDFDGTVIAHQKNATMQRNSSLEFSPSGDRILVASWDNTLSVYSIAEDGK
jgi:WD40 repeat protein